MALSLQNIEEVFAVSCPAQGREWFAAQRQRVTQAGADLSPLDIALAMARRTLGTAALPSAELAHWNLAEAGRVLLLDAAQKASGLTLVPRAYAQGDEYEREAILKGLIVLDPMGEHCALAVDACRTNVLTMLSAIALDNPYPGRYFGEHEFNQMVLKCLFLGFDVSAVTDLPARLNSSMSRMCYDYLRERMAAGRDFPASIWLTIRVHDIEESQQVFTRYLDSDSERHRYYVTRAIVEQATSSEPSAQGAELLALAQSKARDESVKSLFVGN